MKKCVRILILLSILSFYNSSLSKQRDSIDAKVKKIKTIGFFRKSETKEIFAEIAGHLDYITTKTSGQYIFPGEIIAKIDETKANHIYNLATKDLEKKKLNMAYAKELYDIGLLSKEVYETYRESLAQEESNYKKQSEIYHKMIIRSSTIATIDRVNKLQNERVLEGDLLFKIKSEISPYIEATFSEKKIQKFLGKNFRIFVIDSKKKKVEGQIQEMLSHNEIFSGYKFKIIVSDNQNFEDGSIVKLEIFCY